MLPNTPHTSTSSAGTAPVYDGRCRTRRRSPPRHRAARPRVPRRSCAASSSTSRARTSAGAGMAVERADQVTALTRAHADDADRARAAAESSAARMCRCTIASRRCSELPGRRTRGASRPSRRSGCGGGLAQPASAFSIESTTSGASGSTIGEKRAITLPSRPTRNFSKFQRMSPVWPSASALPA